MGYPGDHGRSGGQPTESYDSYDSSASSAPGSTDLHGPADATPPQEHEAVYDAGADRPDPEMPHPGHRGPPPRGGRNVPLLLGGGAVALIVLAGAGVGVSKLLRGGDETTHTGATSAATPSGSRPSPSVSALPTGALGAMLTSRSTDPRPLTLREVFRRKAFTVNGVRYVMAGWHATRACGKTAHGAKLVSALRAGGCNQVVRGTFARADGVLAGTIGIANMKTARAASITAKLANAGRDTYLQPLPGRGVTKNLGKGIAFASAEARGHYVLLSWIQAPSGKPIPKSRRKAATVFQPNVVYGSKLSFSLQYRGIAGKPYGS
jgi:hypothetical protein